MTAKQADSWTAPAQPGADDLTLIHGIGPGIALRLRTAGIATFAQLAECSASEIAALLTDLAGISAERIGKQDWIGQAGRLRTKYATEPPAAEADVTIRQHYATFTVELLLDENNVARRTRSAHVQSGCEETWVGWPGQQLLDYVVEHSQLDVPPSEPVATAGPDKEPKATQQIIAAQLIDVGALPTNTNASCKLIEHDQPFDVRVSLDFGEPLVDCEAQFEYIARIQAKKIPDHTQHLLAEARGICQATRGAAIDVAVAGLGSGMYRLEAFVGLGAINPDQYTPLDAHLEGGLINVY